MKKKIEIQFVGNTKPNIPKYFSSFLKIVQTIPENVEQTENHNDIQIFLFETYQLCKHEKYS
jgi:hypothetical protein